MNAYGEMYLVFKLMNSCLDKSKSKEGRKLIFGLMLTHIECDFFSV